MGLQIVSIHTASPLSSDTDTESTSYSFAIAAGVLLLLQIFFMPETTFIRESIIPQHAEGSASGSIEKTRDAQHSENVDGTIIPARGYVSSLRPWSGIHRTRNNVLVLLARPMLMLFTPIGAYLLLSPLLDPGLLWCYSLLGWSSL